MGRATASALAAGVKTRPTAGPSLPPASVAPLVRPALKGVDWVVHDRTHLELEVVYPVARDEEARYQWEAYFFVPQSFQLPTRGEKVKRDFRSRLRRAVRVDSLAHLAGTPLERLQKRLASGDHHKLDAALRLYGCRVHRASVAAMQALGERLGSGSVPGRRIDKRVAEAQHLAEAARRAFVVSEGLDPALAEALRITDEYVSVVLETFLSLLATELRRLEQPALADKAVKAAVEQAAYRDRAGYRSVMRAAMTREALEELDDWRHTLKRYTASVLWLSAEGREPGRLMRHGLYAIAASVAMAFAVVAMMWNGTTPATELASWALIAVVAYAIKDRIKAGLAGLFDRYARQHLPDVLWRIGPEGGPVMATATVQTVILDDHEAPAEVLAARRSMVELPSPDDDAHPVDVVRHRTTMEVAGPVLYQSDGPYAGLVEVCRLDLAGWLRHTDDPKRRVVFADPETESVYSERAPRCYTIDLLHRVTSERGDPGPWRKGRVVVSRKGIRRLEPVD
ncbi:MAG: hypothetical protein R3B72_26055 [Polyangiaceae bacterium]